MTTLTAAHLAGLTKSQFLDRNQHFAKRDDQVATVLLIFQDGQQIELTKAQYSALPTSLKQVIREQDSL